MGDMWSSYLKNQTDEESKSKEAREEEAYARKRSRDVMTTMCVKNIVNIILFFKFS